jgi:lysophospholipid acyltransferase (LPLAT)-like uncharacterized protein
MERDDQPLANVVQAQTGTWHGELQMAPTLRRAAETWLAAAYHADGEEAEDAFEQAKRAPRR